MCFGKTALSGWLARVFFSCIPLNHVNFFNCNDGILDTIRFWTITEKYSFLRVSIFKFCAHRSMMSHESALFGMHILFTI